MTQKQLESLVKKCRILGIVELEFEGVKLKLAPEIKKPLKGGKSTEVKDLESEPQYTDEEILFWSAQDAGAFKEQTA